MPAPSTLTFSHTGSDQTFTVPSSGSHTTMVLALIAPGGGGAPGGIGANAGSNASVTVTFK